MKIDTHVHSSGISKCSRVSYQEIAQRKKSQGYGGAILMNHCQPWYYDPKDLKEWINSFIEEFNNAYNYGKSVGFTFFLGIEVSISIPRWADFLLFGVSEEFLLNAPDMCRITQEELFDYCQKYGVLMVQAHPQRESFEFMDCRFMHGVEVNLSKRDIIKRSIVEEYAKEKDFGITVGSDYHEPYEGDFGGIIIPNEIQNSIQLVEYLNSTKEIKAFIGDEEIIYNGFKE